MTFYSKVSPVVRIINLIFNIYFYYFTSKAFSPNEDFFDIVSFDLLTYVMIGELSLSVIHELIISPTTIIKEMINYGTLDLHRLAPRNFIFSILYNLYPRILIVILYMIFEILFLKFVLDFSFSFSFLALFSLIQIAFYPLLFAFGIMLSCGPLVFQRGSSFLGNAAVMLGILSGAYFPINVFPQLLKNFIFYTSPYYHILYMTRFSYAHNSLKSDHFMMLLLIFIVGISFVFISHFLLKKSFHIMDKRGSIYILGA